MKNIWDVNIQVGDNILDVIKYREDRSKAKANFDRVLNGESFTVVEQYGDESINRNWYQSEYSPLYDNSNNVIGLTVFSIDITERKQAEIALKENEEKFRTLFEQNMLSIYLHDVDGNIIDVNTKACSQLGYSREELLEMSVFDFIYTKDVGGHSSKQELLNLWNQMEIGKRTRLEGMFQRQDGSVMYAEVSTGLVRYNNREMIMALASDITKRKQAEKQLQDSYKELEIKQSQIDAELEKAKEIHEKTLLGKFSKTGSPEDISLEAHYYPTKQIGGDFYNFIRVENKLIIYLSDVTGHGIEAAIISSFVKDTIANYADLETGELTPEKMLTHVHKHYINNDFPEDYFVCLYVAVLDLDTYELTYSAAGMQFPLFVKLADGNCINLQSEGPYIKSYWTRIDGF